MNHKELFPHIELETLSKNYQFSGVVVELQTTQREVIDFCDSYFFSYATVSNDTSTRHWLVLDSSCDDQVKPTCTVDKEEHTINLSRNSTDIRFVMRIIRSLVMLVDIEQGKLMFKGSGLVNKNGAGIVFFGEKGGGKTSVLLSYLMRNDSDSRFVTNSHVSLSLDQNVVQAAGYPMAIGVRLPGLEALEYRGIQNLRTLINDLNTREQDSGDGRHYLDPADIEYYFHSRVVSKMAVNAIVIVESDFLITQPTLKKLSESEITTYIINYYQRFSAKDKIDSGWFDLFPVNQEVNREAILALVEKCVVYKLIHSPNNPRLTLELIDSI